MLPVWVFGGHLILAVLMLSDRQKKTSAQLKIYCHLKVIEMKNKSTASLNTETTVCLLSQLIRDEMLRR